jgi:BCD family chlorophyll transporter-like MFS transporter
MSLGDVSNLEVENSQQIPRLNLPTMLRLGLFQVGLGMMSVLVFGVLNRVLIKELGVPATMATIILATTLFVAPARVWFGLMSDTKPLWGYHRTGYVWIGAAALAILSILSVQVMWQVGGSLQTNGWSLPTYSWMAFLALMFGLYGLAVGLGSISFATLLVDVSDEDDRSRLVGIDWAMLIGGTIVGAATIGILLKRLPPNPSLEVLQPAINTLFAVMPAIVFGLALVATWGIENKYSRYQNRSTLVNREEKITLKKAWQILTASRQTQIFFSFLLLMTMGLFMQDSIMEPFGGRVFNLGVGETATLNIPWGTGTLIGILVSGFLIVPRLGKRQTTKIGCLLVAASLVWVILSGFTHNTAVLLTALLFFGLFSGVLTSGAITLMLDLTAAETAGTFIGAWGLSQALARGIANVLGGVVLDVNTKLFGLGQIDPNAACESLAPNLCTNLTLAYGLVFVLQAVCMLISIRFLQQVNVQEFRTNAKQAIATVIENELD